ncbi:MAG: hypothetical protein EBY21_05400 [Alphaproteobacteria bacterium]|nr:hypothetical protein [Alphaproteobacteria bacterium]
MKRFNFSMFDDLFSKLGRKSKLALLLLLGVPLSGCALEEKEFVWHRPNGDELVLSYHLDLPAKKIWFKETLFSTPIQDELDAEEEAGRRDLEADKPHPLPIKVKIIRDIDDCQIVDARNWYCEDRGFGNEAIYMINGVLHYNYFRESRDYVLRNVLTGRINRCKTRSWSECKYILSAYWGLKTPSF